MTAYWDTGILPVDNSDWDNGHLARCGSAGIVIVGAPAPLAPAAVLERGPPAEGTANGIAQRAPHTEGPSPMVQPKVCSRPVCKPFCSARPVRAPKDGHWPSTWQSASKDVPVTGVAGERIMLRVCLSQVRASPSAEKGLAILGNLSRTCPVVGASLEALSLMRSIPLPWVRARGAHCKTACAQFTGKANASPLARSLRGGGVLGQRASCPLRQRRGANLQLPKIPACFGQGDMISFAPNDTPRKADPA